jgi:hypothetical protein
MTTGAARPRFFVGPQITQITESNAKAQRRKDAKTRRRGGTIRSDIQQKHRRSGIAGHRCDVRPTQVRASVPDGRPNGDAPTARRFCLTRYTTNQFHQVRERRGLRFLSAGRWFGRSRRASLFGAFARTIGHWPHGGQDLAGAAGGQEHSAPPRLCVSFRRRRYLGQSG